MRCVFTTSNSNEMKNHFASHEKVDEVFEIDVKVKVIEDVLVCPILKFFVNFNKYSLVYLTESVS